MYANSFASSIIASASALANSFQDILQWDSFPGISGVVFDPFRKFVCDLDQLPFIVIGILLGYFLKLPDFGYPERAPTSGWSPLISRLYRCL